MSIRHENIRPTGESIGRPGGLTKARLVIHPILALLAAAAGCGAPIPAELLEFTDLEKTATTESHSDFRSFEYTCTPGLGFDAATDGISHATIAADAVGNYWLDISVWQGSGGDSRVTWEDMILDSTGDPNSPVDAWSSYGWSWEEPVEQSAAFRALSAAEVLRMRSVFAAIPVEVEYVEAMIDYYEQEDVRWDARRLSANPNYGYSETIAYSKVAEIVDMLEDFRSASQP